VAAGIKERKNMMEIIQKRRVFSSWEELKKLAYTPNLGSVIQSGDMIPVTMKNGEEIVLKVTRDETGKTFFIMDACMMDSHYMSPSDFNNGGWANSALRKYLNAEVFGLLPDDLQAVIVPTTIVQIVGGKRIESEDKLFLLSKTQVFGRNDWSDNEPQDTQLDCFQQPKDRMKLSCGSATAWWLRSPLASSSSYFCFVTSSGSAYNINACYSYGVSWGFCIN
jgi:hypothetical protein